MYELLFQNEVKTYGSRLEAVTAAKELTVEDDGRMTCNVSDGIETLSFRGGKLIAYTYETRRNEARDRSQSSDGGGQAAVAAPKAEPESQQAASASDAKAAEADTATDKASEAEAAE